MITASPSATIATFPSPAEDPYEVTTPWGARIGAWAVCEPSGARDDQYSWTRDGAVIPGIRSHWYFLTIADEGTYLRCGPADGAGPMSPEVCIGTCLNNRGDGAQDDEPLPKPPRSGKGAVAPAPPPATWGPGGAPTIPAPTTGAPTGRPTVSSSPSISSSPTEMPSVAPSRKPKSTKAPTTKSTKAPTTATTRSSKSTKAAKSAKSLKAAKGET